MTLRLYAERKALPLEGVTVELRHSRIHAVDCENCETKEGMLDQSTGRSRCAGRSMRSSGGDYSKSPTSVRSIAR
jgi:hypothetical protein